MCFPSPADQVQLVMAQQGGKQVVGNQVVGNIGMYYAAYRLSQQGWNVMPTSRNARGVDMLIYGVKASSNLAA
jgi:hypothetical protein